ncbi:MAG: DUF4412 domain-containing protein [Acidobacteriota bacterium]|nr:DUF4412 domain-containing protein [Acidobacteriota bacterium]
MKKTIALCLFLLPASLLCAQGRGGGGFHPMGLGPGGPGGPGGSRTVVTGAPYSGVEIVQSQEVLADGNRITHKRQTTVYRDLQGRVRSEETSATGTAITIIDPVAGYRYMLDPSANTAYQSPLPPMRTASASTTPRTPPTPPEGATIVKTSLGTASVNGVAATGTQITETIAAGAIGNAQPIQVVRITWIANDLKVPVQIKSSDPRFGTTDMELTNITTSEPSASLFMVPAGYTTKATGFGMGAGPQARGPRHQ